MSQKKAPLLFVINFFFRNVIKNHKIISKLALEKNTRIWNKHIFSLVLNAIQKSILSTGQMKTGVLALEQLNVIFLGHKRKTYFFGTCTPVPDFAFFWHFSNLEYFLNRGRNRARFLRGQRALENRYHQTEECKIDFKIEEGFFKLTEKLK